MPLRVAPTAALDDPTLRAIRALVDAAFDGDFADEDWANALGGTHALVIEDGVPVAHGSVVERRLWHAGRALRGGYVEAMAVRADQRRRGHGAAVLAALEAEIGRRWDLGALSATEQAIPFYLARGWRRWRGPTAVRTAAGDQRTPDDDGGVFVREFATPLDLDGPLTCDWRPGDVW